MDWKRRSWRVWGVRSGFLTDFVWRGKLAELPESGDELLYYYNFVLGIWILHKSIKVYI